MGGAGDDSVTIVSPGSSSNFAAELYFGGQSQVGPSITQSIPVCPGSNYSIGFDYSVPATVEGCNLVVFFGPRNVPGPGSAEINMTETTWTHYSFPAVTFAGATFTVGAQIVCNSPSNLPTATALVDNFSVQLIPGTTVREGCPLNVTMENGGFEDGSLKLWERPTRPDTLSSNVNYSVVSPGLYSNYMFQADFHNINTPSTLSKMFLQRNNYQMCLGYNYSYLFAYRFKNYDDHYPQLCSLEFESSACAQYSGPTPKNTLTLPSTSTWIYAEFRCRATSNVENGFGFSVTCQSGTGPPEEDFKNFSFQLDTVVVKLRPVTEYH
jgi:hypothetical protein